MQEQATLYRPVERQAVGNRRVPVVLLTSFAFIWTLLAISPINREDWLLENLLVFAAIPTLVATYKRFPLTNLSYICLFVFFVLHAIGAHYTYSLVPYDRWLDQIANFTLQETFGWARNHFDRLVHFSYGLLITPASIELLDRRAPAIGVWRWILPVCFITAHSSLFEVMEAIAAAVVAPELGDAYLGTQGDSWDAQKDTALAMLGAVITTTLVRLRQAR